MQLDRQFNALFVHDAITYIPTEADLSTVVTTARAHCRPGGVALFVPDFVTETFRPGTDHGGHDSNGRGMRYLEWRWDPGSNDTTYLADMVYMLREDHEVSVVHDRQVLGLSTPEYGSRAWGAPDFGPFETIDLSDGDVLHLFVGVLEKTVNFRALCLLERAHIDHRFTSENARTLTQADWQPRASVPLHSEVGIRKWIAQTGSGTRSI